MLNKHKEEKNMSRRNTPSTRNTLAKIAFYTFVIAAVVYLVQAILGRLGFSSDVLSAMQNAVIILLFVIAGVLGWVYCHNQAFLLKVFYFICVAIILVAVILPLV